MADNSHQVIIAGNTYYLKTNKESARLAEVAQMVDGMITALETQYPQYSHSRIATLASLQLAEELMQLREDYEQLSREVELLTESQWKK